jgi:hypothetical protein
MLVRKLLLLLATAGIIVPGLLGGSAAASPPRRDAKATVYVVDCVGDRAKVKPVFVVLACGDGGAIVAKAKWTHWGSATATAHAQLVENTCVPTCAGGTFVSEPARVTLGSIVRRQGRREYSRIRVVPAAPNRHHFKTIAQPLPG